LTKVGFGSRAARQFITFYVDDGEK